MTRVNNVRKRKAEKMTAFIVTSPCWLLLLVHGVLAGFVCRVPLYFVYFTRLLFFIFGILSYGTLFSGVWSRSGGNSTRNYMGPFLVEFMDSVMNGGLTGNSC